MPVNMFKFGFSKDEPTESESEKKPKKEWLESEEIVIKNNVVTPELLEKDCPGICSVGLDNKFEIKHVSTYIVADMIRKKKNVDDSIFKAEQKHSDLISAVYEGGLKIWQCTYDLLEYIYDNKISLKDKKVLDLGCGTGIIGIYAFINGAKVYFQDYNPEVVRYVTIPNVLLNAKDVDHAKTCKYYSGDWKSFADLVSGDFTEEKNKFDYIFTSETIYNVDNYDKLLLIFKSLLKKRGIVYLAAKTYYFGVGGGTRQFEDDMDIAKCYEYETCWYNLDGVQREILKIRFK